MATTKTSGKVVTNILGKRVTPSPMVVREKRSDLWWGKEDKSEVGWCALATRAEVVAVHQDKEGALLFTICALDGEFKGALRDVYDFAIRVEVE